MFYLCRHAQARRHTKHEQITEFSYNNNFPGRADRFTKHAQNIMANLKAEHFFDVCDHKDLNEARLNDDLQANAGTVTLHVAEAQWIYEHDMYILTYSAIYQPHYSVAQAQYYFSCVLHKKHAGWSKRGRFHVLTAQEVNKIIGHKLLAH